MSIPTLLVCDGEEPKQQLLEGLIKNEAGLRYIATVSKRDGSRAVEQAIKVGTKLLWIDLDDEPVEGLNLLAESRQLFPQLPVVVSKGALDADMVRASVNLGALDFLDPTTWVNQIKIVVAKIQAAPAAAAPAPATNPNPAPATAVAPAPAPNPSPATAVAPAPDMAAKSAAPPATPVASTSDGGGKRWGDLDSIPTPSPTSPVTASNLIEAPAPSAAPSPTASVANAPAARAQEATGEIHLGAEAGYRPPLAVQVQAPAEAAPAPSNGGNKWGDLDSIGAGSANAPAVTAPADAAPAATPAPTSSPAPAPAPSPVPAPALPTTAAISAPSAPLASPSPNPSQSPPSPSVAAESEPATKWGDLDAIPTPKADPAPAPVPKPIHATGEGKWGELDAIPGPSEKPRPVPPTLVPAPSSGKGLKRPAPEKAEMYNIPAVPIWMIILVVMVLAGCAVYVFVKPH